MTAHDPTFTPESAYGSERWCSLTLGKSYEWFRKARPDLEADGFPRRDALLKLTMKADVHAWIARRRKIADYRVAPNTTSGASTTISKENLNGF